MDEQNPTLSADGAQYVTAIPNCGAATDCKDTSDRTATVKRPFSGDADGDERSHSQFEQNLSPGDTGILQFGHFTC